MRLQSISGPGKNRAPPISQPTKPSNWQIIQEVLPPLSKAPLIHLAGGQMRMLPTSKR